MKKIIGLIGVLILMGAGCSNRAFLTNEADKKQRVNEAFEKVVTDIAEQSSEQKAAEIGGCENKFSATDFPLSFCYSQKWGAPMVSKNPSEDPAKGIMYIIYFKGISGPTLTVYDSKKAGNFECIKCLTKEMSNADVLKNFNVTKPGAEVQRFEADGKFGFRIKADPYPLLYYIPNAIKSLNYDIVVKSDSYGTKDMDAFISTMKF